MARRGKSQARRSGSGGSLPGWVWLLIGALLALVLVLLAPRYFKSSSRDDGFFRPRPNADARPAISALDEHDPPPARAQRPLPAPLVEPDYDFYTVLPEQETALSDTELAARARAEARIAQEQERAEIKARAVAAAASARALISARSRSCAARASARAFAASSASLRVVSPGRTV